jgi:hypothetical protein
VGPDSAGNLGTSGVLDSLEVIVRLKVHPELRCRPEIAGKAERCVCRDRPLAPNNVIHPRYGHHQLHRQPIRRQAKRFQEVLSERFTRMDGRHGLIFFRQGSPSSVIIDENAVLPSPVPRKTLKTIPRNRAQIGQRGGGMQVVQLALSRWSEGLKFPAKLTSENLLGLIIPEGPNHDSRILLPHV